MYEKGSFNQKNITYIQFTWEWTYSKVIVSLHYIQSTLWEYTSHTNIICTKILIHYII